MDLKQLTDQAQIIVSEASDFIKDHYSKVKVHEIEVKDHNSLVSYVDKGAEKILVNGLSQLIPDCGFLTEEDTENDLSKEYIWIIDPLDGTTNFLHNIPYFSVSVALWDKKNLLIGIIKDVMIGDIFTAYKNGGAYMNGVALSIQGVPLSNALIATGFPYTNDYPVQQHFEIIKHWLMNGRGMRRFGSAALDLCYVAAGRTQAYYESTLNTWDVAAGILIVQEAGGLVTDWKGGDDSLSTGDVVASSKELHAEILAVIMEKLSI